MVQAVLAACTAASSVAGHEYYAALLHLQRRLIALQDHIVEKGLRVVVLFEGRDSAGKGGAIKRITQHLDPRVSQNFVRKLANHFAMSDSRFERKLRNDKVLSGNRCAAWLRCLHPPPMKNHNGSSTASNRLRVFVPQVSCGSPSASCKGRISW
eukprot:COSAG02_NODE_605_length_19635_cov_7.106982_9_plen_154_part_00